MQKQSFELFADYNQFYLWDESTAPEAPTDYTEEDVARRLKTGRNVVVIQPERNMTVPVTVEIHEKEPVFDFEAWDHIAECSLDLPSGNLEVHECTGGSVAKFKIEPGAYRVRAFYAELGSLDETGLDGDDHYLVVLWPSRFEELRVVKQFTAP